MILASAGCGSSDDIELADLPRELAEATCAKAFDCCPQDSAMEFPSEEQCVTTLQGFASFLVVGIQQSEQAGRARYDGARASECMDVIRGLDCTQFRAEELPCDDFIVPLVAAGGECDQDFDCVTGYCSYDFDADIGTCATLPGLGQACDFDCAQGSYCEFSTSTCEAAKADGAECFDDEECLNYYCDLDTGLCGQEPACM
jgi:hypothetical protein